MPLETVHPDYAAHFRQWQRIRDCIAGEDAVKAAKERYLPRPSGMDDPMFDAYVERACFFGATRRTVQGLHGAMFRKAPEATLPAGERYAALVDNIDLQGTPLDVFASTLCWELLAMGRVGILTDMTAAGDPYLIMYIAENITNWREADVGNVPVPDQFILMETYTIPALDGFGSEIKKRYRVLELDENGLYRQRIFQRPDQGGEWVVTVVEPKVRGNRLNTIPFSVLSPTQLQLAIETSPIKELVDMNVSHYRTSADLEHGAHWTATPTPWVSGPFSDVPPALSVGSMAALVLPEGSQVGMLTLKGDDLGALFKQLEQKQAKMAQLGARLLEDQKRAAETAESKRLQYSGENSVLATIANTASRALTRNIGWAVEWLGGNPADVAIQVNTDFFDATIDPTLLSSMLAAVQGGYMSTDTFIWNLIKGELTPPGRTVEEEKELIEMQGPSFTPNVDPPPADADAETQQVA
jgi:hypothetical protein